MSNLSNKIGSAIKGIVIIQIVGFFAGIAFLFALCGMLFVSCHEEGTSYDKLNKKEIEKAIEKEHGIDAVYESTEIFDDEKYYIFHDSDIPDLKFCGYSASTDTKFAWGYVTKENYIESKRNYEVQKLVDAKILNNTSNVPVIENPSPYEKSNVMITVTADSFNDVESCADDIVYLCDNFDCEIEFVYAPAFNDKLFTIKYYLDDKIISYGENSDNDFKYNSENFSSDAILNDVSDLCRLYKDNCDLSQEMLDSHNGNDKKVYKDICYVDSNKKLEVNHYKFSNYSFGELYYIFKSLGFKLDGNPVEFSVVSKRDGDIYKFSYNNMTSENNYYYIKDNKNYEVGTKPILSENEIERSFDIVFVYESAETTTTTAVTTVVTDNSLTESTGTVTRRPLAD